MLKIRNCGPIEYRNYIKNKMACVWGAGRALESCQDIYFSNKDIFMIIDRNEKLWGKIIHHNGKEVSIVSPHKFTEFCRNNSNREQISLMITSPFYAAEIVDALNLVPELDGIECFIQALIRNTKEESPSWNFTKGTQKIPKIIHYIWVGKAPLPEEFLKNIESWKKYNPDYEIMRWDETNYDFSKCDYVKRAYESKAWGFASNYARLDIMYRYGGIYLDTDVEAVSNFDVLLNDEVFFCIGNADRVNIGCGFGAKKDSSIIKNMCDEFEKVHFEDNDAGYCRKPCHLFIHNVLRKNGICIENRYQNNGTIALYPKEVMSPLAGGLMDDFFSEKTVSVHKEAGAWKSEKEKAGYWKLKELIETYDLAD